MPLLFPSGEARLEAASGTSFPSAARRTVRRQEQQEEQQALGASPCQVGLLASGGGSEEGKEDDADDVDPGSTWRQCAPRIAGGRAALAVASCGAAAAGGGALLPAMHRWPGWQGLVPRPPWPDSPALPRFLRGFVGDAAHADEGLLAHVAWELEREVEREAEMETWQMLQVAAAVYSQPRASSEQTGTLHQCSVVRGASLGDGWVRLEDQQGYAPQRVKGVEVLTRLRFEKRREEGGSCEDVGFFSIEDSSLCQAAGTAVGLQDWTMSLAADGCFAVSMSHPDSLQPLCSTAPPCGKNRAAPSSGPPAGTTIAARAPDATTSRSSSTSAAAVASRTATSTTTVTSTTLTNLTSSASGGRAGGADGRSVAPVPTPAPSLTSRAYGSRSVMPPELTTTVAPAFQHPSLFCFEVYRSSTYEEELVVHQFHRKTSIHACDEHMIISDEVRDLPPASDGRREATVGIGSLDCKKGSWGSWANAPIFLKAWQSVIEDGRYERHDWVVKVDADCVFRPRKLRLHIYQSQGQGRGTERAFYKNFMDGYPVVGAIEVTSRQAVHALATDGAECENMALGAAEDDWFARCLKSLGAVMMEDGALLQHDGQPPGNKCTDAWWVAVHPYKDLASYTECEGQIDQ